MIADEIGDVHQQSVGFAKDDGELWIAKREIADDIMGLGRIHGLTRVTGGKVTLGGGENSWVRTDGDECPEQPGYIYIVVSRERVPR